MCRTVGLSDTVGCCRMLSDLPPSLGPVSAQHLILTESPTPSLQHPPSPSWHPSCSRCKCDPGSVLSCILAVSLMYVSFAAHFSFCMSANFFFKGQSLDDVSSCLEPATDRCDSWQSASSALGRSPVNYLSIQKHTCHCRAASSSPCSPCFGRSAPCLSQPTRTFPLASISWQKN